MNPVRADQSITGDFPAVLELQSTCASLCSKSAQRALR